MVDYTPYLRLAKPPFDEIPWDEAVNGNMDTIDAFTSVFMQIPNFAGVWKNDTQYVAGQNVLDISDGLIYTAQVSYGSSSAPTTFAQERALLPTFWAQSYPAPPVTGQTYNNTGRNIVHNGMFRLWQKGLGPFTSGFTSDGWQIIANNDTASVAAGVFTDADRLVIGEEIPFWALEVSFTGVDTGGSYTLLRQRIETLRRLSGKIVTLSFWAQASSALSIGINLQQIFGTGGSPSADVRALSADNKLNITTEWARHSLTFSVPSSVGQTFGTNLDNKSIIEFFLSSAADVDAITGGIGVQSGTIGFWGIQLELGSAKTPLEYIEHAALLDQGQRYYQSHVVWVPGAGAEYAYIPFPTVMAATPTISGGGAGFTALNTSIYGTNVRQTTAAIQTLLISCETF